MTLRLANTAPVRWAGMLIAAGLVILLLGLISFASADAGAGRIASLAAIGLGLGGIVAGLAWTLVRRARARRGLSAMPASRLWLVAGMELAVVVALGLALWPWRGGLEWLGNWGSIAPVAVAGVIAWRLIRSGEPRLYVQARGALAQGDVPAALRALDELERAYPLEVAGYILRARILRGRGDAAGAAAAAQRAIALRPRLYYGHAELGQAELGMGRVREAVAALEKALTCAPYLGEARLALGLARPAPAEAAQALAQALNLGLRDPAQALMTRYRLWRALQGLGMDAEAEREERRLRRLRGLLRDWQPLPEEVALRDEIAQALRA